MNNSVTVELGERSYQIIIKKGVLNEIGGRLKDLGFFKGKAAVVTNPLVDGLYGGVTLKGVRDSGLQPVLIKVPDGEEYKNLKEASRIYDSLIEHGLERSSPLIALGGGVIGDITGFVAATYLRGVPYIQVPTTLLSQVDSSVGGKTGVNHPKGKNLIGAFYQPRAVLADPLALKTLDKREFRAGLAEVVKYGVIWDKDFFSFLEKNTKAILDLGDELTTAITRSCAIKAEVVSKDEREAGLRAILNFGHTFGHAIETLTGYRAFRHGEAVAAGMALAAEFSSHLGLCERDVAERIKALLSLFGLPAEAPPLQGVDSNKFLEPIRRDKKVAGGRLRFVLTAEIGRASLMEVEEKAVIDFLKGRFR